MTKEILNFKEALEYTGFSKSYLYKLTSGQKLPCSKPGGKLLYFHRSDIDAYLLSNRRASIDEIRQEAHQHAIKLEKKGSKHVRYRKVTIKLFGRGEKISPLQF